MTTLAERMFAAATRDGIATTAAQMADLELMRRDVVAAVCTGAIVMPPPFAASATPGQHANRRKEVRKARKEVKQVAGFAIGLTLLGWLVSWGAGRLLNWFIEWYMTDVENITPTQWATDYPGA